MADAINEWKAGELEVRVYRDRKSMGKAAASALACCLVDRMGTQHVVNVVFAAAPSQDEFLAALVARDDVDWGRVQAFHLDEYVGLEGNAPQKFGSFLDARLFSKVKLREVYYIDDGRGATPDELCSRYERLLRDHPIDVACLGIGENGHIAFNDPHVADFDDAALVKTVSLDRASREQQVHDGCFPQLSEVPTLAVTMTIPALMAASRIICVVPGPRKREAVARTLQGPITTDCPASVLRRHPRATLYLDGEAAADVIGQQRG